MKQKERINEEEIEKSKGRRGEIIEKEEKN